MAGAPHSNPATSSFRDLVIAPPVFALSTSLTRLPNPIPRRSFRRGSSSASGGSSSRSSSVRTSRSHMPHHLHCGPGFSSGAVVTVPFTDRKFAMVHFLSSHTIWPSASNQPRAGGNGFG
jgi:hypothetical protein